MMNRKEFRMKRIAIVLFVTVLAVSAVSAQGFGARPGVMGQAVQPQVALETTTIEGKLSLVQGHPAIESKGKVYFVQIPQTLYGFVDGLKEGASVKLVGYEMPVPYAPNSIFFRATTLTIGAKSYDLSEFVGGGMMGGLGGARGGFKGSMGSMGGAPGYDSGSFGGRGRR